MSKTHIAGSVNRVGDRLRQRCAWCGVVLIDDDLSCMMSTSTDGCAGAAYTWTLGSLVRVDGGMSSTVTRADPHELPDDSCAIEFVKEPPPLRHLTLVKEST